MFSDLSMVFFDTISLYFEGEGGVHIGQFGHSKDHRPDPKQVVVAVILDNDGNPICSEIVPGNTTDVTTLIPVVQRLKSRFGIERICMVADRGMISEDTVQQIEQMNWEYILCVRMHRNNEVKDDVWLRGGRFTEVFPEHSKAKDKAPLKVKEVNVGKHRYVVCHNLAVRGWNLEWADMIRDVDAISEVAVTHDGKNFIIRTEASGVAGKVFQAAGIALPPVLREA